MPIPPVRPKLGEMGRRTIYALVIAGAVVIAGSLIAASVLVTRGSSPAAAPLPAAVSVDGAAAVNELLAGIPQQGAVLGQATAPVTLEEYVDLQCPYCALFATESFPSIVRGYVRTGRVKVVFRGLSFLGPDSSTALETALAAGSQQRLWQVVELLFANQGGENSGWVTEDLLRGIGGAVPGLAVDRLLASREEPGVATARTAAQEAATSRGVTGTPAFSVGPTGGALQLLPSNDVREIRAALDAALRS
jgi:protein-disulfide isomerase